VNRDVNKQQPRACNWLEKSVTSRLEKINWKQITNKQLKNENLAKIKTSGKGIIFKMA